MKILDTIEQKVLFNLLRALSFIIIIAIMCSVYFAVSFYNTIEKSTSVSLSQVKSSQTKKTEESTYPPLIAKYFTGDDNKKVIAAWLEDLDEEQRKDFLANLNQIVSEAESKNENVIEVINSYQVLKQSKMASGPWDKQIEKLQKGAVVLFISIMVGITAVFTLVLVMLAIERNTRSAKAEVVKRQEYEVV